MILSLSGGIIFPVYVLYFREFQITLFQVAVLAAVFEATIIIFEIPTGLFADRYGRRLSTITGFILFSLAGIIFFEFRNFAGFLIAEGLFGLAETFISGAMEALAVDSIDKQERKGKLATLFANRTIIKTSALLIGMITGGLLAEWRLPALFLPLLGFSAIGAVLALLLVEPEPEPIADKDKAPGPSLWKFIWGNPVVAALFAVGLLANFIYEPIDQFWQVLFSEIREIDPAFFGLMTASGLGLVIIFTRWLKKLYHYLTAYLAACFIILSVALYLAALSDRYPAVVGIVVYFSIKEMVRPVISTHLNRHLESKNRATYLSAYNLTCSIGEVAASLLAGILAAQFGVVFLFYFGSMTATVLIGIYLVLKNGKNGHGQMDSGLTSAE